MKNRIFIGVSSIILIFMILCLAVFSLLSLSDAKSALTFAEKRAVTVKGYYAADAQMQTLIRDYRRCYEETGDATAAVRAVSDHLPEAGQVSQGPEGNVICTLPMESGQTLYTELTADGMDVLSYYVYNSTEYTIDSDLPVWDGN